MVVQMCMSLLESCCTYLGVITVLQKVKVKYPEQEEF